MNRSGAKWLPGAMALAATAASTQAAVVQITLTGNKISSTGGNQLVADLTGDGYAEVAFNDAFYSDNSVGMRVNGEWLWASVVNLVGGGMKWTADAAFAAGVGNGVGTGAVAQSAAYLNPITFTDRRINGGAPTGGWLQVNAYNTSYASHTVEFSRLIFDDANTTRPAFASIPGTQTEWSAVPEPSSFLLLTLGAGGLIARRRRQAA